MRGAAGEDHRRDDQRRDRGRRVGRADRGHDPRPLGKPDSLKPHIADRPGAGRPAHRLDRHGRAAARLDVEDLVRGRAGADDRVVRENPEWWRKCSGRTDRPDGVTLVVLGGGPAQRHAIDAARRWACARWSATPTRARRRRHLVGGRRGRAARRASAGARPDRSRHRLAGAGGRRGGRGARPAAPARPATARCSPTSSRSASVAAAAGVPQPAWSLDRAALVPGRRQGGRPSGPAGDEIVSHGDESRGCRQGAARLARGRVLYEGFVPGPEVTVNGFAEDGRHRAGGHRPRSLRRRPRRRPAPRVPVRPGHAAAARTADAAVAALGIARARPTPRSCCRPDGPRVIEVAARLGGGHDSELVRIAAGVDLATAAVRAAPESLSRRANSRLGRRACVIEFLRAPAGVLAGCRGRRRPRSIILPGTSTGRCAWRPTGPAT